LKFKRWKKFLDISAKGNDSPILQVPSSIIEDEIKYLLNPKHPDFKKTKMLKAQPFVFDSRIKK